VAGVEAVGRNFATLNFVFNYLIFEIFLLHSCLFSLFFGQEWNLLIFIKRLYYPYSVFYSRAV
jgi:hypothetical protein